MKDHRQIRVLCCAALLMLSLAVNEIRSEETLRLLQTATTTALKSGTNETQYVPLSKQDLDNINLLLELPETVKGIKDLDQSNRLTNFDPSKLVSPFIFLRPPQGVFVRGHLILTPWMSPHSLKYSRAQDIRKSQILEVVLQKEVIKNSSVFDQKSETGAFLLYLAALSGERTVKTLIQAGCTGKAESIHKHWAVQAAASNAWLFPDSLDIFLRLGFPVNLPSAQRGRNYETPLALLLNNYIEVPPSADSGANNPTSGMYLEFVRNCENALRALVNSGADASQALPIAISKGYVKAVELLLELPGAPDTSTMLKWLAEGKVRNPKYGNDSYSAIKSAIERRTVSSPSSSPKPGADYVKDASVGPNTSKGQNRNPTPFSAEPISEIAAKARQALFDGDVQSAGRLLQSASVDKTGVSAFKLCFELASYNLVDPLSNFSYTHEYNEASGAFLPNGKENPLNGFKARGAELIQRDPQNSTHVADAISLALAVQLQDAIANDSYIAMSDYILFSEAVTSAPRKMWQTIPFEILCSNPDARAPYMRDGRRAMLLQKVRGNLPFFGVGLWVGLKAYAKTIDPSSAERWRPVYTEIASRLREKQRFTSGCEVLIYGAHMAPWQYLGAVAESISQASGTSEITSLKIAFGYACQASRFWATPLPTDEDTAFTKLKEILPKLGEEKETRYVFEVAGLEKP